MSRRLRRSLLAILGTGLVAALAAATETDTVTALDPAIGTDEWDALCWELSQGTLDTSTVSPGAIRAMMQPTAIIAMVPKPNSSAPSSAPMTTS